MQISDSLFALKNHFTSISVLSCQNRFPQLISAGFVTEMPLNLDCHELDGFYFKQCFLCSQGPELSDLHCNIQPAFQVLPSTCISRHFIGVAFICSNISEHKIPEYKAYYQS